MQSWGATQYYNAMIYSVAEPTEDNSDQVCICICDCSDVVIRDFSPGALYVTQPCFYLISVMIESSTMTYFVVPSTDPLVIWLGHQRGEPHDIISAVM